MTVPAYQVHELVEVYNAKHKIWFKGVVKEVVGSRPHNTYKVELYARAPKVTQ